MSKSKAHLEKGHTPIKNYLLKALYTGDFTLREVKLVLALARLTYGFADEEDPSGRRRKDRVRISKRKLCEEVGIDAAHFDPTFKALKLRNVVTIHEGPRGTRAGVYGIQSDTGKWLERAKAAPAKSAPSRAPLEGAEKAPLGGALAGAELAPPKPAGAEPAPYPPAEPAPSRGGSLDPANPHGMDVPGGPIKEKRKLSKETTGENAGKASPKAPCSESSCNAASPPAVQVFDSSPLRDEPPPTEEELKKLKGALLRRFERKVFQGPPSAHFIKDLGRLVAMYGDTATRARALKNACFTVIKAKAEYIEKTGRPWRVQSLLIGDIEKVLASVGYEPAKVNTPPPVAYLEDEPEEPPRPRQRPPLDRKVVQLDHVRRAGSTGTA